jgi:hypothetical protein
LAAKTKSIFSCPAKGGGQRTSKTKIQLPMSNQEIAGYGFG